MNLIDVLIRNILMTKNPSVIGLDPDIKHIPTCYKNINNATNNPLEDVANVIVRFNCDIIDTICDIIPAVKPQMAFYEKYGSSGVVAFEETVRYAKSKGVAVIEDAKRNDIGNTAKAYADGHLGSVELLDGSFAPSFDADFLTVTPFLGRESLYPFVDVCKRFDKGIFVLVKTSNPGSGEIQDAISGDMTVSQNIAEFLRENSEVCIGEYGYSSIGAVVGATYPNEATVLRNLMPRNYFLVPGYGAQGGEAGDIIPCFNPDGLGAIVNSSRGLLYNHLTPYERETCTKEEYLLSVRNAALQMQKEIYTTLKSEFPQMIY